MSSTTPIYDLSLVVLALTKPSYFQHTETCSLWWKDESPVYFLFAYLRQPCIITNRSVWLKPERNMTHHELLRVSHPVNEDLHRDVWVHNVLDPSSGIYAHQILRAPPRHLIVGVSTLGSSLLPLPFFFEFGADKHHCSYPWWHILLPDVWADYAYRSCCHCQPRKRLYSCHSWRFW